MTTLFKYGNLKPPNDENGVREIKSIFPWPLVIHRYRQIPFKKLNDFDEQNYDGFVIIPQHAGCQEPTELISDLDNYMSRLDSLMAFASEPNQQDKYKKTTSWIHTIKNFWNDVINRRVWKDNQEP